MLYHWLALLTRFGHSAGLVIRPFGDVSDRRFLNDCPRFADETPNQDVVDTSQSKTQGARASVSVNFANYFYRKSLAFINDRADFTYSDGSNVTYSDNFRFSDSSNFTYFDGSNATFGNGTAYREWNATYSNATNTSVAIDGGWDLIHNDDCTDTLTQDFLYEELKSVNAWIDDNWLYFWLDFSWREDVDDVYFGEYSRDMELNLKFKIELPRMTILTFGILRNNWDATHFPTMCPSALSFQDPETTASSGGSSTTLPTTTTTTRFPAKFPSMASDSTTTRSPAKFPSMASDSTTTRSPAKFPTTASPSFTTTRSPAKFPTTTAPSFFESSTTRFPARFPTTISPSFSVPTTRSPAKFPTTTSPSLTTTRFPAKFPTMISPSFSESTTTRFPAKFPTTTSPSFSNSITRSPAKFPTTTSTTTSFPAKFPTTISPSFSESTTTRFPVKFPTTSDSFTTNYPSRIQSTTATPTIRPSFPTLSPTSIPTDTPTTTLKPTPTPSSFPTSSVPSLIPTTSQPTHFPTSSAPTIAPVEDAVVVWIVEGAASEINEGERPWIDLQFITATSHPWKLDFMNATGEAVEEIISKSEIQASNCSFEIKGTKSWCQTFSLKFFTNDNCTEANREIDVQFDAIYKHLREPESIMIPFSLSGTSAFRCAKNLGTFEITHTQELSLDDKTWSTDPVLLVDELGYFRIAFSSGGKIDTVTLQDLSIYESNSILSEICTDCVRNIPELGFDLIDGSHKSWTASMLLDSNTFTAGSYVFYLSFYITYASGRRQLYEARESTVSAVIQLRDAISDTNFSENGLEYEMKFGFGCDLVHSDELKKLFLSECSYFFNPVVCIELDCESGTIIFKANHEDEIDEMKQKAANEGMYLPSFGSDNNMKTERKQTAIGSGAIFLMIAVGSMAFAFAAYQGCKRKMRRNLYQLPMLQMEEV